MTTYIDKGMDRYAIAEAGNIFDASICLFIEIMPGTWRLVETFRSRADASAYVNSIVTSCS